jgi:hypothetical protein
MGMGGMGTDRGFIRLHQRRGLREDEQILGVFLLGRLGKIRRFPEKILLC